MIFDCQSESEGFGDLPMGLYNKTCRSGDDNGNTSIKLIEVGSGLRSPILMLGTSAAGLAVGVEKRSVFLPLSVFKCCLRRDWSSEF